ncbi:MAG TPA: hypothetical protein ENH89_13960 [Aurantimonas coralicida]|nr:hypothetical protein [Aurantimonas coralicida]
MERKQILVTVDTDLTDGQIEHNGATLYLCEGMEGDHCHPALDVKVYKGEPEPKPKRRSKTMRTNTIIQTEGPGAPWRGKFRGRHLDGGDLGNGEGRCIVWVVTLTDAVMLDDKGEPLRCANRSEELPARKRVNVLAWSMASVE